MKLHVKDWLQLGRAQTWPATFLLIMTPFLTGESSFIQIGIIAVLTWLIHVTSFGHNSLMDTAMGYDLNDPSKKHHPLVAGRISLHVAHNVIHWGLNCLSVLAILLTTYISPAPIKAVSCIFLCFVFGYSYNSGLDKETLSSFLPITICFTAMGAWGWFLSHKTLNTVGWLYLSYIFFTILFQISWSGHLKEMELKERSNILIKMGAKVQNDRFYPGKAWIYGCFIKGVNLLLGGLILLVYLNLAKLVWYVILTAAALFFLDKLTKQRVYNHGKELFNMSLMEIATIYLVLPLMLKPLIAAILMVVGVVYFLSMNLTLWGKPYPRV